MEITFVDVIIDRDATVKIPVSVPEYEVPILEAIHGEANIFVQPDSDHEVEVDELTAAEAWNTLQSKYSQNAGAVKEVFRSVKNFAKESGLPYKTGDEEAAKAQQSQVIIGGKVQGHTKKGKTGTTAAPKEKAPAATTKTTTPAK